MTMPMTLAEAMPLAIDKIHEAHSRRDGGYSSTYEERTDAFGTEVVLTCETCGKQEIQCLHTKNTWCTAAGEPLSADDFRDGEVLICNKCGMNVT